MKKLASLTVFNDEFEIVELLLGHP